MARGLVDEIVEDVVHLGVELVRTPELSIPLGVTAGSYWLWRFHVEPWWIAEGQWTWGPWMPLLEVVAVLVAVLVAVPVVVGLVVLGLRHRVVVKARHAVEGAKVEAKVRLRRGQTGRRVLVCLPRDVHLTELQLSRLSASMQDNLGRELVTTPNYAGRKPVIVFERPAPVVDTLPTIVRHPGPSVLSKHTDRLVIPFGTTEGGLAVWDTSSAPHLLVAGETGGGKTRTLETVAYGAVGLGASLVVLDPKRFESRGMRRLGSDVRVATDPVGMSEAIEAAWEEMDHRNELLEADHDLDPAGFQPLVMVVDEFTELRDVLNEWFNDPENRDKDSKGREHPVLRKLWSLVRMGRAARVHLVFATQRPDTAESVPGSVRDNMLMRIQCGRMKAQGSQMMWGDTQVGWTVPPVKGRGLCTGPEGPVPVQLWLTELDRRGQVRDPGPAPIPAAGAEPTSLYRFYDGAGELLYVGITKNGRKRWLRHEEDKAWWSQVATSRVEHFPSRTAALKAEAEAIRRERPRFNVQHNGAVRAAG